LTSYSTQLREFVGAFPQKYRAPLLEGLDGYLARDLEMPAWDSHKFVWQTDKAGETRHSDAVRTWSQGQAITERWNWTLMTDKEAWVWAEEEIGGSRVGELWRALPTGILVRLNQSPKLTPALGSAPVPRPPPPWRHLQRHGYASPETA